MVFKVLERDCEFFFQNKMNCGAGVMSESKDLGIKLFGRKIPVPAIQIPAESALHAKILETEKLRNDSSTVRLGGEGQQTAVHGESGHVKDNTQEDNADANLSEQEKVLKKPDKILPCPRCHSLDTKFCYFNNYNVNQPRHFCKNCQRYWTAGGTMRNVPIGAGRRKNKHLTSQYRLATLSGNGLPETRIESADPASHHFQPSGEFSSTMRPTTSGGTVLKFGPETSLSNSVETVLNLKDQAGCATGAESREDASSFESSVTVSNVQENILPLYTSQNGHVGSSGARNDENPPHPLQFYPVPAWYLPWNPAWRSSTSFGNSQYPSDRASISNTPNPTSVQWCPAPMLAVPNVCPPSIPLHILSASYMGGIPLCAPRPGDISSGLNGPSSPSYSASNTCASTSLALGKHFRDPSADGDKLETGVLVPKTLRIEDPNEAAKSPLWTSLGINPDKKDPCLKVGFESKGEGNGCLSEGNGIMEANPAALSRSQTFQEST